MSTASTDHSGHVILPITVSHDMADEIERDAAAYGLKPSAYLVLLHAISSGKVPRSFGENVKEIFTKDRHILEKLAK
ncbi:MAG: hypothetical protein WD875_03430 [Pirellulales bacterium]